MTTRDHFFFDNKIVMRKTNRTYIFRGKRKIVTTQKESNQNALLDLKSIRRSAHTHALTASSLCYQS